MRIHRINLDLTADNLTSMIEQFAPEAKFRVTSITPDGIRGQIKLLLWSVDFTAKPMSTSDGMVSIEIGASKLVPIPPALVQRQLKEAMKDAPTGVDVIQQALKVHLPSILAPFGISLVIRELRLLEGFLHVSIGEIDLPDFKQLMESIK